MQASWHTCAVVSTAIACCVGKVILHASKASAYMSLACNNVVWDCAICFHFSIFPCTREQYLMFLDQDQSSGKESDLWEPCCIKLCCHFSSRNVSNPI